MDLTSSRILTDPLKQKLLLIAAAAGMFLDGLDGSIVNIILPELSIVFNVDTGTISWVTITYLLMMSGLIIIFGKIAEKGYFKRIFLMGIIIFVISSAACGLSGDFAILLSARIFQGIGAAMLAATASLLCVTYLPLNKIGMSLAVISISIAAGVAAGPAIGGILAGYLSWHWIFFINVPIGLAIIPFAYKVIPKDLPESLNFDIPGAILLFIMMVSGVYGLERLPHLGFYDIQISACIITFVLSTLLFIIREKMCMSPLINLHILTLWKFTLCLIAFFIINIIFMGVFYLLPFFLSSGLNMDSLMIGVYLLIPPIISLLIGVQIGKWSDRIGRRPFAIATALIVFAISSIFMFIKPESDMIFLFAGLILLGLLGGIFGGPVAGRIVDYSPDDEKGTGTSLTVTSMYLGGVVGVALFATTFTFATTGFGHAAIPFYELDIGVFMTGFSFTMFISLILSIVALIFTAIVPEMKKKNIV